MILYERIAVTTGGDHVPNRISCRVIFYFPYVQSTMKETKDHRIQAALRFVQRRQDLERLLAKRITARIVGLSFA